eukprot:CAMPEP_0175966510 /NCGR_PEP_ID=MMETSP0108-20121206/38729_1 /TAXON_ID=195067 ORGANISM="Goniomonas pacifica, Strain CCMP1869" /NCGR_SAMPLE_ID=MMETSP0108 /ASSEMBLY_ACC=CAM_ASM_000204 /LENGTH=47 /DNA_ID= /DNA_START= /DNA_END= /DNA_ORIENTATION=
MPSGSTASVCSTKRTLEGSERGLLVQEGNLAHRDQFAGRVRLKQAQD